MGLFDDFMGIAKELNEIKNELTSTVGQVAKDATGLTSEATDAFSQIKDGASSKLAEIKDQVVGGTSPAPDNVNQPSGE